MKSWKAQRRGKVWARGAILTIALVLCILPITWTALASFDLQPDDTASPPTWTVPPSLDQFVEIGVAEPTFWQELATSAGLSVAATLLTLVIATLAGYGLVRSRAASRLTIIQGFLVLASLPVMAYIIPLSDMMRRSHLMDTFVGLVLAETAVNAPLAVFVLSGYLAQLPAELEESAWLDGAGLGQILWRIVVPLAAPGMAAMAIILFVLDWNLFLVPLILTAGQIKTIPVAMSDFFTFERELEWPTAAAAIVISLLPLTALALAFQQAINRFTLRPVQSTDSSADL